MTPRLPDNLREAQRVAIAELTHEHGEPDVLATVRNYAGSLHPLVRLEWYEDGKFILLAASGQAVTWRYWIGGDDVDTL